MNKHLKTAFFIAPVLALLAFAVTGYYIPINSPEPGNYRLLSTSPCKPVSGSCVFRYADLELKLISQERKDKLQLAIISNQNLISPAVALAERNKEFEQFKLFSTDGQRYWQLSLGKNQSLSVFNRIRLATHAGSSAYFIETEIQF